MTHVPVEPKTTTLKPAPAHTPTEQRPEQHHIPLEDLFGRFILKSVCLCYFGVLVLGYRVRIPKRCPEASLLRVSMCGR